MERWHRRGCYLLLWIVWVGVPNPVHSASQSRCELPIHSTDWLSLAKATTDSTSLLRMFRKNGYRPPARTYLMAARILPGVGQPAFQYVSMGQTGWVSSVGHFWPASTIKLWAAVGALMRLREHQLDHRAILHFSDGMGSFRGTSDTLIQPFDNLDYDRLLRIATMKRLNGLYRQKAGLSLLFLSRTYGGSGNPRRSPRIFYLHQGKAGHLPASTAQSNDLTCKKNCTSLLEIQEVLRRVVLHKQLPRFQRFPIATADIDRLKHSLRKQWKWIDAAIYRELGKDAQIYSKAGSVPGNHLLDNTAIFSKKGNYLLTVASPWPGREFSVEPALHKLNEFARQALMMLSQMPTRRVTAQSSAGTPLQIQVQLVQRTGRKVRILATGRRLTRMLLWQGTIRRPGTTKKPKSSASQRQEMTFTSRPFSLSPGRHIFVLHGYQGKRAVAYRAFAVDIPPQHQPIVCKRPR